MHQDEQWSGKMAEPEYYEITKKPEDSDWGCRLFGAAPSEGMYWLPSKGNEPNWFWRWMQYLFFGNRWEKTK